MAMEYSYSISLPAETGKIASKLELTEHSEQAVLLDLFNLSMLKKYIK